jgi:hypothetical protein
LGGQDPVLLGELALVREDLAQERELRTELEEKLQCQFTPRRVHFAPELKPEFGRTKSVCEDRDLADVELGATCKTTGHEGADPALVALADEAWAWEATETPRGSRFSVRRLCGSLSRRPAVQPVDENTAAAA